jgi:hypothetical protein
MANHPFNTYTTTPSLGATDLANIMGAGFVVGFGGFGGLETRHQPKTRRPLKGLFGRLAALLPGNRSPR